MMKKMPKSKEEEQAVEIRNKLYHAIRLHMQLIAIDLGLEFQDNVVLQRPGGSIKVSFSFKDVNSKENETFTPRDITARSILEI